VQPTLVFGKTHKTSRKAGTILNMALGDMFREDKNNNGNGCEKLLLDEESLVILDGGCDIGATLGHIATTLTNSNLNKAKITYGYCRRDLWCLS
jgi:hypothetical protein